MNPAILFLMLSTSLGTPMSAGSGQPARLHFPDLTTRVKVDLSARATQLLVEEPLQPGVQPHPFGVRSAKPPHLGPAGVRKASGPFSPIVAVHLGQRREGGVHLEKRRFGGHVGVERWRSSKPCEKLLERAHLQRENRITIDSSQAWFCSADSSCS